MRRALGSFAVALLCLTAQAEAHPMLVAATPAANAAVPQAKRIELRFSEPLLAQFSGAVLTMIMGDGGQAENVMAVESASTVAGDGRTLVVTPSSPLSSGQYGVAWHAVASDSHRVTGNYTFTVK